MEGMVPAIILLLGASITAFVAHKKGRSAILWWVFGFALLIIALPWALLMSPNMDELEKERASKLICGYKECPKCFELIKQKAIFCKHCKQNIN